MHIEKSLRKASAEDLLQTLMKNAIRETFIVQRVIRLNLDPHLAISLIGAANSTAGIDSVEKILDGYGKSDTYEYQKIVMEHIDWNSVGTLLKKSDATKLSNAHQQSAQPMKQNSLETYTYFIESAATGLIKIGRSVDPEKRLKELQTAAPDKLSILKTFPENLFSEASMHEKFAHLRRHGEWFEDSPEIRDFIAAN